MNVQPLGILVNENSNQLSADTWALVLDNVVIMCIICQAKEIYLFQPQYDYLIDLNIQGQGASPGWTYNPAGNTFTEPPPPPIDWNSIVQQDFITVANNLNQCIYDAFTGGQLTTQQIQTAFAAAIEDDQVNFTQNQMALMNSILNYVQGGG